MTTHKPTPSNQYGMYFNGTLPSRGASAFDGEQILEVGKTFEVGDSKYTRASATTVRLKAGPGVSTDKLVYLGVVYDIVP
jgi:hypothetical protein